MTDQDLIRRCVERAEGWTTRPHNADLIIESHGGYAGAWFDPEMQDMLAAQLVRQVDSEEKIEFSSNVWGSHLQLTDCDVCRIVSERRSPNRTLNTLRVIDEFYRRQEDD